MKKYFVVAGLVVSLLPGLAQADLKWDQTLIELHPNFGDKDAVGHFKYQNTGSTPVRIQNVKTSCGCTVAQAQKEEVAPGEKGEITATFNIGNHVGTQVKTITVTTDQSPTAVTSLTLKAVLPEGLTLLPTFVYWKVGEAPKPKTIIAKAGDGFAATKVEATAQNAEFSAVAEPAKEKGTWKITVTPQHTDRNIATTITVKTDFPKNAPQSYYANASVAGIPVSQPAAAKPNP